MKPVMQGSLDETVTIGLTPPGCALFTLWVLNVAPSKAPKGFRSELQDMYRDFDYACVGIGIFLHAITGREIPLGDCKTPAELRRLAIETIDEIAEKC